LGARLAEPGEFTQRAFLNGKLDLAQAESIADLIDATSGEAARCAVRSLQGVFSNTIHAAVKALINLRMFVEATLDFPEEEIEALDRIKVSDKLKQLEAQIEQTLLQAKQGNLLREGLHVVLIGQPNAGKSSLLNCLAGDEVAIVTPIPGTTRDPVRQHIHLHGVPLHFIDTAGLRETDNEVERIGIERTWKAISQADIIILLIDCTKDESDEDTKILAQLPNHRPIIYVFNKIDLNNQKAKIEKNNKKTEIFLSAKTGDGVELLSKEILAIAGWQGDTEHGAFMARTRHIIALQDALQHLRKASESRSQVEFLAEELKHTQSSLATITGEFTSDDLLGEIFSHFCIGK
jgi:tRNA modification GTPase